MSPLVLGLVVFLVATLVMGAADWLVSERPRWLAERRRRRQLARRARAARIARLEYVLGIRSRPEGRRRPGSENSGPGSST